MNAALSEPLEEKAVTLFRSTPWCASLLKGWHTVLSLHCEQGTCTGPETSSKKKTFGESSFFLTVCSPRLMMFRRTHDYKNADISIKCLYTELMPLNV